MSAGVRVCEDVTVIRSTEVGVLMLIDNDEVWVPKSGIHDDSEVWIDTDDGEGPGVLIVKDWLAEKRGWE